VTLPDGRGATLLLAEASTVLSVDGVLVSSWDLGGRPYALVREDGTYRRGLDGRLLHKWRGPGGWPRIRRRLSADGGAPVVEAAREEAALALRSLRLREKTADGTPIARQRLQTIVAMDTAALRKDATRFLEVSGPVGILPPDQYLSLVVRLTEGCSWNACAFCRLYREVPFRAKTTTDLARHLAALRAYFGAAIALRRAVFVGDANALCLSHDRLRPALETVARTFPGAPLFSFVDAWTGARKRVDHWRAYARLGLVRVYVGLETGDPELLAWLGKPGSPDDAVALVSDLHAAGVAAGVVVLLGAGGKRFAASHAALTARVLTRMRLGPQDLVYFSELVEEPGLEYGRRDAGDPDLVPLPPERAAEQRRAVRAGLVPLDPERPPRSATYDIREFVY
jgi:Radical SAM superfamily